MTIIYTVIFQANYMVSISCMGK